MKKTAILLFFAFISAHTFAQNELPVSVKRVNGKGACGTASEIRVYFNALSYPLPTIEQIRSEQRDVAGIVITNIDASDFDKKGYVSYCIISADIIPVHKLSIRFHYANTGQDYWLEEMNNKAPVHPY